MACTVTTLILEGDVGRLTLGESRIASDLPIVGSLEGCTLTIWGHGAPRGTGERVTATEREVVCPGSAWHWRLETIYHRGTSPFMPPAACFTDVTNVYVTIHRSGDVMLPALALENFNVNVWGSGSVLARGVRAQYARLNAQRSGNIVGVYAHEYLEAMVKGSGDITVGVSPFCSVYQYPLGSGRITCSVE